MVEQGHMVEPLIRVMVEPLNRVMVEPFKQGHSEAFSTGSWWSGGVSLIEEVKFHWDKISSLVCGD
jgi:hypothetical protein